MSRSSKWWKRGVTAALAVVLVLDAILLVINVHAAGAASQALFEQRSKLRAQHALLAADVRRAEEIRARLPRVQQECDRFFAEQLPDATTGYSSVVADLGEMAKQAGLRSTGVSFKQRELEKRGVIEVGVTAAVEGDYTSVVRFINGLERSKNFYLLDSLALASSTGGGVKLNLQLRSYFRS